MSLEIETVKPLMTDENKIQSRILRRFNHYGTRYYFDDNIDFYPSVTSITGKVVPKSNFYYDLVKRKGEGFDSYFAELAKYGTIMHKLVNQYWLDTVYMNDIDDFLKLELSNTSFQNNYYLWIEKLKKNFLSIVQFFADYKVEPIAVEYVGFFNNGFYRFAGAMDLICEIEYKGKKQIAIIDYKSGESSLESHQLQLQLYREILNQKGFHVDLLINVSPKDWNNAKIPTYNIKVWDNDLLINPYLDIFFKTYQEPKNIMTYSGRVDRWNLNLNYEYVELKDYLRKKLGLTEPVAKKIDKVKNIKHTNEFDNLINQIDNLITTKKAI